MVGLFQRLGRMTFLSTPSVRRATASEGQLVIVPEISIHALRTEGDPELRRRAQYLIKFLSTPSVRRATDPTAGGAHGHIISIHALRTEGD